MVCIQGELALLKVSGRYPRRGAVGLQRRFFCVLLVQVVGGGGSLSGAGDR